MKIYLVVLLAAVLAACAPTHAPVGQEAAEDARAIEQLRKGGADLAKPYLTRYYLYFSDERSARAAEPEVVKAGYVVERQGPAARGPGWLLLVRKHTLLSVEQLSTSSRELSGIARGNGGTYDGWEAEVRK